MKLATFLLGCSFLLSKILGLLRDHLLASGFGTLGTDPIFNLDTYYAAFRLPDLLFNLLSYGVLSAAFVPLFTEILHKEGRKQANRFTNQILHTLGSAILIFSLVLFILAPYVIRIFLPGFSEENVTTTANLARIMLVTPILFTIGSTLGGVANALHKYIGLAVAPIVYNLGIILGILFLAKPYGVYGVSVGVVFGALLHLIAQIPQLLKAGFRYEFPKRFFGTHVREMIKLSLPRIFGMSVTQISLIVDTVIASTLASGSIAVINFAANLESLPIGIIGISVAIVSFGTLAVYSAEGNLTEFIAEIKTNIRRILFLLIPLALGMFTLRFQIVRLILGRGKFDWSATILTANTLGVFLSGLIFGSLVFLLARGFYALKNTKTPVTIGIIAVLSNIVFSILFTKIWKLGPYGLALSNSIADILNTSLLIILLSRTLKASLLDFGEIAKYIVSGLLMVGIVQLTKIAFGYVFADIDTYVELTIQTASAVILGATVYFGMCWVLRCKEIPSIKKSSPIL